MRRRAGNIAAAAITTLSLLCGVDVGLLAAAPTEPRLLSVFPIGGQAGTFYRATVRGRLLDGTYGIWFGAFDLV